MLIFLNVHRLNPALEMYPDSGPTSISKGPAPHWRGWSGVPAILTLQERCPSSDLCYVGDYVHVYIYLESTSPSKHNDVNHNAVLLLYH